MVRPNVQTTSPNECAEVDPDEIQAAKRILAALIAAVKNYSLYPTEHSISRKGIQHLRDSLSEIFQYEDNLRIEISKDGLFYKKIRIYQPATKNDPLVTPLFRDGILWIAIYDGIEPSELEIFLKRVADSRLATDEAECDVVTALWKANLPHLRYEAINSFWESQPQFDFSHFKLGPEAQAQAKDIHEIEPPPKFLNDSPALNIKKSEGRHKFFELTAIENQLLKKIISKNNEAEDIEDVISILMILLEDQKTETDFIEILDFLEHELKLILANAHFDLTHALLEKIKQLICDPSGQFSWRNKLIHDFFFKISLDEILEALETGLSNLKPTDSNQILSFKRVMLMLKAQAVYTLADLLLKLPSRTLQILLMDIIKTLSLQDLKPLERLLDHPNPLLVKKLITILAHLRSKRAKELLSRLMDHPSDEVRQKALFWVIKRGELPADKVLSLIEDPNSNVRAQVFEQMGREKNPIYERMLRRYIEEKKFRINDSGFLMNCYQALGKCASNESLLFLEKKLFQVMTLPLVSIRKSLHRQGAALGLIELETQDAKQLLNKASRCFYPPIRRAYKRALEFKLGVK